MVASKPSGDLLSQGGIGQHVARQLFDDKLVVWHVVVVRLDDPVAPNVLVSIPIVLISVGVCVP